MSNGSYKYMRPDIDSGSGQIVFQKAFSNTVKSVTSSLNNIVIKTYPGMANAVAAYIDSLHDEEILGCVAGDDCIIIVARNVEAASFLSKKIQEIVSY
jgi:transcriptional regulator of arginine metabolism